jgi:hypothetical protein
MMALSALALIRGGFHRTLMMDSGTSSRRSVIENADNQGGRASHPRLHLPVLKLLSDIAFFVVIAGLCCRKYPADS